MGEAPAFLQPSVSPDLPNGYMQAPMRTAAHAAHCPQPTLNNMPTAHPNPAPMRTAAHAAHCPQPTLTNMPTAHPNPVGGGHWPNSAQFSATHSTPSPALNDQFCSC